MKQPLLIPIIYNGAPNYQLYEGYDDLPKGLVIDGASIPRILWVWKPPDGIHRGPAAHHDWNYIGKGWGLRTRKQCDDLLYAELLEAGLAPCDARLMWLGVRIGGWYVWNKPKVDPVILPVRNAAPSRIPRAMKRAFSNHLYAPPYES